MFFSPQYVDEWLCIVSGTIHRILLDVSMLKESETGKIDNCRLKTNDSVEERNERFILFYEFMRIARVCTFSLDHSLSWTQIYFIYRSLQMKRLCQTQGGLKCLPNASDAHSLTHTARQRDNICWETRATIRSKQTNIYDAIKFKICLRGSIP